MKLYRDGKLVFNAPEQYVDVLADYMTCRYNFIVYDAKTFIDVMFDGENSIQEIAKMTDKDFCNGDLIVGTPWCDYFVLKESDYCTDNENAINFWYKMLNEIAGNFEWKIETDDNPKGIFGEYEYAEFQEESFWNTKKVFNL